MSGAANRLDLPVVLAGAVNPEARRAFEAWTRTVVVLDEAATAPDPTTSGLVWLSPRTLPDESLQAAVADFARISARRVGVAPWEVVVDGGSVPLGERVIVADAGAARVSAWGLEPVGAAETVRLSCSVRLTAPDRIGEHLRAINDESSIAAALGARGGDDPSWRALAVQPVLGTLRAWLGATGNRERAFSVAFLENFAPAATAAKLWEYRHPESEPAL